MRKGWLKISFGVQGAAEGRDENGSMALGDRLNSVPQA